MLNVILLLPNCVISSITQQAVLCRGRQSFLAVLEPFEYYSTSPVALHVPNYHPEYMQQVLCSLSSIRRSLFICGRRLLASLVSEHPPKQYSVVSQNGSAENMADVGEPAASVQPESTSTNAVADGEPCEDEQENEAPKEDPPPPVPACPQLRRLYGEAAFPTRELAPGVPISPFVACCWPDKAPQGIPCFCNLQLP